MMIKINVGEPFKSAFISLENTLYKSAYNPCSSRPQVKEQVGLFTHKFNYLKEPADYSLTQILVKHSMI